MTVRNSIPVYQAKELLYPLKCNAHKARHPRSRFTPEGANNMMQDIVASKASCYFILLTIIWIEFEPKRVMDQTWHPSYIAHVCKAKRTCTWIELQVLLVLHTWAYLWRVSRLVYHTEWDHSTDRSFFDLESLLHPNLQKYSCHKKFLYYNGFCQVYAYQCQVYSVDNQVACCMLRE